MTRPTRHLRGGIANLRYGRKPFAVRTELVTFARARDLDFVCVQELSDYADDLTDELDGWRVFCDRKTPGGRESGLLVREQLAPSNPRYRSFGDGWITVRGGKMPARPLPRVSIGKLRAGSIHVPQPSTWIGGQLIAPEQRRDDLVEIAKGAQRFFRFPGARLLAGDWNEPKTTQGHYSPHWIAATTGAQLTGSGIDYVIAKGCEISRFDDYRDTRSDHPWKSFLVSL